MVYQRCLAAFAMYVAGVIPAALASTIYAQTNLTSNIPGLAANLDPDLKNPWGMAFSDTSPFWISDEGAGLSTLYNGAGQRQGLVVSITSGKPTGQVHNGTGSFIVPGSGQPALFLFASEEGDIDAWNPTTGSVAVRVVSSSDAAYTGLALANNGSGSFLYAANLPAGRIDVFDSSFNSVTLSGSFTDPVLPAGYSPFNIANVNGQLYVTYAKVDPATGEEVPGAGLGIVSVFDANGNFVRRLATGGSLNAPWGVAVAPSDFGEFGDRLLIGNFGDGTINAFDILTGNEVGTLRDAAGKPIANEGLWDIRFRTGGPGVKPNALYFTAGINDEEDGLFGSIEVIPEPATAATLASGLALIGIYRRRRPSAKANTSRVP